MRIYKTKEGDRWDWISYKFYGFSDLYYEIIKANPQIGDDVKAMPILEAGIEIVIPDIEKEITYPEQLPSWKR